MTEFSTKFHYFIYFEEPYSDTSWLIVLHNLIFSIVQHCADVWLFNKNLNINLKDFTADSMNYLGWESNYSFISQDFC